MTATTPGHDSAELVTPVPEDRPTEPFRRIEAAPADSSGATTTPPPAPGDGPVTDTTDVRTRRKTERSTSHGRVQGMPNASPWQRSHAVWHRAGIDWVHAAATIPSADGPAAAPDDQAEQTEQTEQTEQAGQVTQAEPAAPAATAAPAAPASQPAATPATPATPAATVRQDEGDGANGRSGGRQRVLLAAGAAVVLAVGVGGYLVFGDQRQAGGPAPRPSGATLAERWFVADPVARTDGLFQRLTAVAGDGATLVAAGGETGGPDRARFLTSTDGGRTWRTATIRAASGGEPPPEETVQRVAGGTGRWVALGGPATPPADGPGQTVVWTSRDGLTWTRQATTAAFGPQDRVLGLARTATGFVAVGATGGDKPRGVLWSTADGTSWQRVDRPSLGETTALEQVVSSGGTVLVGGTAVREVTKVQRVRGKRRKVTRTVEESAYWRSSDGGRTWDRIDMPKAKGSYGAPLGPVSGPGGFFAAREVKLTSGSGKRRKTVRQAVVWSSPDGARWSAAGRIRISGYAGVERLAGSPAGLAALVDVGDGEQAVLHSGDGKTWQRTGKVTDAEIDALAAVTGGPVLAGRRGPDAYLSAPGAGQVPLASVPGAVRTERAVSALVPDGARLVAVGSSNGEPAAWVGPATGAWRRAAGLDGDPDPQERRWLTDAARGEGGWLAVGKHGPDSLLFTSADGITWKKGPALPGGGFAEGAAAGPGGYVAVGRDGGQAVAWHSADRKKWTRGSGTGEGRMRDVVSVSGGYVAVGSYPGPEETDRPVAWTSTDGRKWTRVRVPALPAGLASGALTRVAARGDVLVAIGSGRTGTPERPYPFIAVSIDAGKSWQIRTLPGGVAGGTVTAVTGTPHGYVIAGTTGDPGAKDVVLWTSADGNAWRRTPVRGTGLDGPGDQRLTALAVFGDDLVATGVSGDHRGDTVTFWRTPLP